MKDTMMEIPKALAPALFESLVGSTSTISPEPLQLLNPELPNPLT